ncbi:MAG TPA: hypothetical protein VFZ27_07690 [Terriglobia bacterium]|nr:hypothetical protein [Terriglobia bacterium]
MMITRFSSILVGMAVVLPFIAVGTPGRSPSRSSARGLLVVDNKGNNTIGIIDPAAGKEIAMVTETGFTAHEVAVTPDGTTAYVPIYGNSGVGKPGTDGRTIDVVDLVNRKVASTITLDRPLRPHCAHFSPTDGLLYVSTELADAVTIIDPKTNKVVGSIPTGQRESHMLAFSHDGQRIYTANVGPGTVSVLDVPGRKTLAVIPISKETQRISVSMDDRYAFTSDQTSPRLAVIDTASRKVAHWVDLPGTGYGTAPTPDDRYLIVAIINKNQVAAVDLKTWKVVHTIDVPAAPQEVLVRPDGGVAFVSCDHSKQIAVINLHTWKVEKKIEAGPGCDGMAWAAHP